MTGHAARLASLEKALDAIHEIARAVLVPRDSTFLYRSIYEALKPVIPFDAGFIERYDASRDRMHTAYFLDDGLEEFPVEASTNHRASPVIMWILNNRKPVRFADLHRDRATRFPTAKSRPFGNQARVSRAWMSVPLLIGERMVGIINVQSYQEGIYGEFEEALLQTAANPIAVAVENANLITALEEEIAGLNIPLIPLSDDVLIVPLLGILDQLRWEEVTNAVLETASARGSECVLLDGSGITSFDPATIQALSTLVRAINLVGARSVLIGLRPSLIEGLIRAGVHLSAIQTARDLAAALRMIGA
ncbi:MAG TPA: GAF domain-containing protein [Herpetosiphonaceae bacterium]|nr:GAF domain-containing protein [Herpetosiphonaceae bacterium]